MHNLVLCLYFGWLQVVNWRLPSLGGAWEPTSMERHFRSEVALIAPIRRRADFSCNVRILFRVDHIACLIARFVLQIRKGILSWQDRVSGRRLFHCEVKIPFAFLWAPTVDTVLARDFERTIDRGMATDESRVKVAVSVRSLNEKERENGEERVVWTQDNEVRVLNPKTRREKVFKFDYTVR